MEEIRPQEPTNGFINYSISSNPSTLYFIQTDDNLQVQSSQVVITSDGIINHEYQISLIATTHDFGIDLFEVDGPTEINRGNNVYFNEAIRVKIKDLTNIVNGVYNGSLRIVLFYRPNSSTQPWAIATSSEINLVANINLQTSANFQLSKQSDAIQFIRNQNTSGTSTIQITSDTNYIVNGPSYIRVNGETLPLNLSGNKTIRITSVDSNELEYGVNQTTITFKTGYITLANLLLNINVSEGNTLEVSANQLHFSALNAENESNVLPLSIFAPNNDVTFEYPSWFKITRISSNYNFYEFQTKAIIGDLEDGYYTGELIIHSAEEDIIIPLSLEVYGYWNSSYNKQLHFSLDGDQLSFYSYEQENNNYISVDLTATVYNNANEVEEIEETLNFYFIDNKASFNLGKYMHDYFLLYENQINDFNVLSNEIQYRKMYELARVNLRVTEKNYTTNETIYYYTIPTQLFLKGHKPATLTSENLGFLGNQINQTLRATCNGKTILNFSDDKSNRLKIYINGSIQSIDIPTIAITKLTIQSIFIDFSNLNCTVGDLVEFQLGTQVLRYQIFPDALESNYITYIDYWGLLRIFEVTGEYKFSFKPEYTTYAPTRSTIKNVDTTRQNTLDINTGYITLADCDAIPEIIHSPKCWFIHQNQIIEIVPVTESVDFYDSTAQLFSFDLQFRINPNRYDNSYRSR